MKETHLRSLAKALSWRIWGGLITLLIVYCLTGEFSWAITAGVFEFFSKIVFFYLHERVWALIRFGRLKEQASL